EIIEQRYPLRLREFSLRENSGGRGRFRGGLGTVRVYETLDDVRLGLWFERHQTPSWGLEGGEDGAPPEVYVTRPGGEREMVLKCNAVPVSAGTVIEVLTGGGGGWGDPAERDPESVAEDRRLGLTS